MPDLPTLPLTYFHFMNKRLATLSAQHPAPVAHVIEDMQRHNAADKQEEPGRWRA